MDHMTHLKTEADSLQPRKIQSTRIPEMQQMFGAKALHEAVNKIPMIVSAGEKKKKTVMYTSPSYITFCIEQEKHEYT